ncbi:MAG: fluoride efflux transporter CrcB [Rubricoccaceae bacterium]
MRTLLLVSLGGALGTAARYGVGLAMLRLFGPGLPWGTWAVNAVGCFLIGAALPAFAEPEAGRRLLLVVGFLGGFTTFSTFSADTYTLLVAGRTGWAVANAVGSVVVGLGAVWLGLTVGRFLSA